MNCEKTRTRVMTYVYVITRVSKKDFETCLRVVLLGCAKSDLNFARF